MSTLFDLALDHVLREEGGLVDHPQDPGGRTNMGITQRKLNEFCAAHSEMMIPRRVDSLSRDDVAMIYRLEYWLPLRCDDMPAPIAIAVFDAGVNAGVARAAKWLQQALGIRSDGIVGSQTIAAARAAGVFACVSEFNARRAWHYMMQDSIDDVFGLGWARRLIATHNLAMGVGG